MAAQYVFYSFLILNFACGLYSFVRARKHLLNTLLRLEYIILTIFLIMSVLLSNMGIEVYFVLFFISLAACEGALGLALLVSVVRTHGRDKFRRFNFLQC